MVTNYDLYEKMDVSIQDDLYFLRKFSRYSRSDAPNLNIEYEKPDSAMSLKMRKAYELDEFIDCRKEDIDIVLRIKNKATERLNFKGKDLGCKKYDCFESYDIEKMAREEGFSLNCRYKTIIFTGMLLALGFRARMVRCLSMDLRYVDCHWITEVYVNSLGKWIAADVPLNLLYFDRKGNPLNLIEMRTKIINGDGIRFTASDTESRHYTEQYLTKNLFRFQFLGNNLISPFVKKQDFIYGLNPTGFLMREKDVDGTIYRYVYNKNLFWNGDGRCT